ncbi:MAG: DUF4159 domain-containing protein, partial [Planctomycetes bacterium]|nr:DUF4159 domain-containing protein [Planctomycetota bacterium]
DMRFRREDIDLKKESALSCPILYMTGLDDFTFSATEIARLRSYLKAGGVLFADSCGGRSSFDKAFRREIKKVIPDKDLSPVSPDHQLFSLVADCRTVEATPALDAKRKGAGLAPLAKPELEGISLGGALSVIYSPLSVGSGWEDESCPYSLGYAEKSARDLGLNILAYSMTH